MTRRWADKLEAYHELGVRELVRFDPEATPGARIEAWNLVEGDLVPRVVTAERAESQVLDGLSWVVAPITVTGRPDDVLMGLRLSRGDALLPTPEEAAERRIADLEAELARLRA